MVNSSKLKLLRILEIMKKTDELHPLTAKEIAAHLRRYGISAERKSIARDLNCLDEAGYSIKRCEDHNKGYYMTDHLFEDFELKILSDAVGNAPFLTKRNSKELIQKIQSLATIEGEGLIAATACVDDSIKTTDKQNKIKLDTLIRAIKYKKKIQFQYAHIGKGNVLTLRREGYLYTVSPYYLVLNQNMYYLIGNTDTNDHLTNYKMDLMVNLELTEARQRNPSELPTHGDTFDLISYVKEMSNMWTGPQTRMTLRCAAPIRPHILSRFGQDVWIIDESEEAFTIFVKLAESQGLYQWLAQYGQAIRVLAPQNVIDAYRAYLRGIQEQYDE